MKIHKELIEMAKETIACLRRNDTTGMHAEGAEALPGYGEWLDQPDVKWSDLMWARDLEAAIAEAEGTQAPQPGPVSDADERAFWREVFTSVHDDDKRSVATAADQADEALKRYRKAFCTGMPSDQKGSR